MGDAVRTRNLNPSTHTRLPRYCRDKPGIVTKVHGTVTQAYDNTLLLQLGQAKLLTQCSVADGVNCPTVNPSTVDLGTTDPAWPATLDGQLSWECG